MPRLAAAGDPDDGKSLSACIDGLFCMLAGTMTWLACTIVKVCQCTEGLPATASLCQHNVKRALTFRAARG